MDNEHQELDETFGSEDATLRLALAEALMEISLLKIELMRTHKRLEQAETALRCHSGGRERDTTVDELHHSQVLELARRSSEAPSVRPKETVFSSADLPALPRQRSALPKIDRGNSR